MKPNPGLYGGRPPTSDAGISKLLYMWFGITQSIAIVCQNYIDYTFCYFQGKQGSNFKLVCIQRSTCRRKPP